MTKETTTKEEWPLHEAVFFKDSKRLEKLIDSQNHDINSKDKFGKCMIYDSLCVHIMYYTTSGYGVSALMIDELDHKGPSTNDFRHT